MKSKYSKNFVPLGLSSSVPLRCGFTLMEILIVVAIISILAGLIVPTFFYAKTRAREAKARTIVKSLETAFKGYLDTYKVWPDDFTDGDISGDLFKVMRGENVSSMNPQQIAFFEFESTSNYPSAYEFYALDSWSDPSDSSTLKAYQVMFDKNYDNQITLPNGEIIYRSVAVWSVGEDRNNDYGGGDDVPSWK
jgi:prepilin-type N-terminal cleavage/methylation domain-containing protein